MSQEPATLNDIEVTHDDLGDNVLRCKVCGSELDWPSGASVTVQGLVNVSYRHIETFHGAG